MKKHIIVTGASRGVGLACVLGFASQNKNNVLHLFARNENKLLETKRMCEAQGTETHIYCGDLSNIDFINDAFTEIFSKTKKISVLVNNAGIFVEKPLSKWDLDEWNTGIDTNLKSPVWITKKCLPLMDYGSSIIFINSIASKKTYYGGNNYCAGKFGLLGFAGSLYEEVRENAIKVCSILPGVIDTDMHMDDTSLVKEKMIGAEDIFKTIEFITSMPINVCPTEITLMPQFNPKKR